MVICTKKTNKDKISGYAHMMSQEIPDYLLSQLSQFVSTQTGLFFPEKKWPEFIRGIKNSALDLGFEDPMSYIQSLLSCSYTKRHFFFETKIFFKFSKTTFSQG